LYLFSTDIYIYFHIYFNLEREFEFEARFLCWQFPGSRQCLGGMGVSLELVVEDERNRTFTINNIGLTSAKEAKQIF